MRAFDCFSLVTLAVCAAALSACESGTVADTLGVSRAAPDEFVVVSRPSLSVPPDFTLRPPSPGAPPRGPSSEEAARDLLLGKSEEGASSTPAPAGAAADAAADSAAAQSFLAHAGATQAQSDIRDLLKEDYAAPANNSTAGSLLEQMSGKDKQEPIVDAKKEAERLRANKDAGKPVTEGEVPQAKPDKPSMLDRIF